MRKINLFLLSALVFALTFTSCNKHNDDEPENKQTPVENNSGNTNNSENNNNSGNTEVTSEKVMVAFNVSGGTGAVEPQTVEKGTKITLPSGEGMKKDGYKFLGWSLTENGEIITEYTVTEKEVTLFAVWVQTFTVKFETDGGTGEFASQTIEKGKTATKPETKPEKENYVFMGWYDGNTKFDFSAAITADVDLKAKYAVLLKGVFTVSAEGKKVRFSSGNLQYHCKNKEWRFAPNQYDCIGDANQNISENYDGYIDLFGFGMWFKDQNPLQSTKNNSDYLSSVENGDFSGTSAIGSEWTTLTNDDWKYLINTRANASVKYGVAEVERIQGLILLPDEWASPDNITFNSGSNWGRYGKDYYRSKNEYSAEQWSKLEANGAVFLPAAGFRRGSILDEFGDSGNYWSTTAYDFEQAYFIGFNSGNFGSGANQRYNGRSVRLVKVVK